MNLPLDALNFQGVALSVIEHNDLSWVTAPDLARALGYERADRVAQLYRRNADEFTDAMTLLMRLDQGAQGSQPQIEVMTAKQSLTRIFSLRGAHLVAMFAKTEIAKEFRRWVLDLIERSESVVELAPALPEPEEWSRERIDRLQAMNTTVRNAGRAGGPAMMRAVWIELKMPAWHLLAAPKDDAGFAGQVSAFLVGRDAVTAEEIGDALGLPGDLRTRTRIGNALRSLGWHSRKERRGSRVDRVFRPLDIVDEEGSDPLAPEEENG